MRLNALLKSGSKVACEGAKTYYVRFVFAARLYQRGRKMLSPICDRRGMWTRGIWTFLAGTAVLLVWAAYSGPGGDGPIRFRNVIQGSGIDFVLESSPSARKHLVETMPGGIAAFDYDGDGLTDIYFT